MRQASEAHRGGVAAGGGGRLARPAGGRGQDRDSPRARSTTGLHGAAAPVDAAGKRETPGDQALLGGRESGADTGRLAARCGAGHGTEPAPPWGGYRLPPGRLRCVSRAGAHSDTHRLSPAAQRLPSGGASPVLTCRTHSGTFRKPGAQGPAWADRPRGVCPQGPAGRDALGGHPAGSQVRVGPSKLSPDLRQQWQRVLAGPTWFVIREREGSRPQDGASRPSLGGLKERRLGKCRPRGGGSMWGAGPRRSASETSGRDGGPGGSRFEGQTARPSKLLQLLSVQDSRRKFFLIRKERPVSRAGAHPSEGPASPVSPAGSCWGCQGWKPIGWYTQRHRFRRCHRQVS